MSTYSLIEIFTMIFVTMGPIKVLVTFAEKTLDLDKTVRHHIAIRAVTVATVVGLVFIFFGFLLMKVFKFSSVALSLAGGLILLIYSIKSILKEPKKGEKRGYATNREAEQMAIYPLAVPLMASPMGLVVLTAISASKEIGPEAFAILTAALLVVMVINLVALLSVERVTKYLTVETLEVANRILALLLAALAMETIINSGSFLAREMLNQL